MITIDDLASEVRTQADRLFPNRTDQSMFLKIYSEIAELIDSDGDAGEYADMLILLLDYGHRKGICAENAIRFKMGINENRVWVKTSLGVMKHVK